MRGRNAFRRGQPCEDSTGREMRSTYGVGLLEQVPKLKFLVGRLSWAQGAASNEQVNDVGGGSP